MSELGVSLNPKGLKSYPKSCLQPQGQLNLKAGWSAQKGHVTTHGTPVLHAFAHATSRLCLRTSTPQCPQPKPLPALSKRTGPFESHRELGLRGLPVHQTYPISNKHGSEQQGFGGLPTSSFKKRHPMSETMIKDQRVHSGGSIFLGCRVQLLAV